MTVLRRHDRYMLKAYWTTFGAALLFLTIVVVVLDLSERLARFSKYWEQIKLAGYEPGWVLVKYYLTLVPFLWLNVLPFCAPLAVVFCISRLLKHNEITPLLTCGVSMRRLLMPVVLSGILITALMLLAEAYVVPGLSREHMTLGRILGKAEPNRMSGVPHFHDPGGARLSMAAYMPFDQSMEGARLDLWREGRLAEVRFYPVLRWNEERQGWVAPKGGERVPITSGAPGAFREPIAPDTLAPLETSLTLLETSLMLTGSLGLSFEESASLLRANPDNPRLVLLYQSLFTLPVSTIVLLLLGIPFAFRIRPGSTSAIPGALGALAAGGLFFGATYFCNNMAAAGDLNPVVLAWLPIVLFGSLGVALFVGLDG